MQYDWNILLFQVQEQLKLQDEKIRQLELQIQKLKDRPALHVDNIEYKFDQLKVERLEGTLNIGLNPSDAEDLEELTVNGENPLTPYFFQNRELLVADITNMLRAYLEKEKPSLITRATIQNEGPLDPQVVQFVLQDLERQLPHRINLYLDQTPIYDRTEERLPVITERIIEKLKSDIGLAIVKFMKFRGESGESTDVEQNE